MLEKLQILSKPGIYQQAMLLKVMSRLVVTQQLSLEVVLLLRNSIWRIVSSGLVLQKGGELEQLILFLITHQLPTTLTNNKLSMILVLPCYTSQAVSIEFGYCNFYRHLFHNLRRHVKGKELRNLRWLLLCKVQYRLAKFLLVP